jgi:formamidopyrimidine-DNA glycosylase
MPELPEVEVVRRDLERAVVGSTVVGAAVTGRRSVRRHSPAELVDAVTGRRLREVTRRGKFLLVGLDAPPGSDPRDVLVVHLRMSGQLRLAASARDPAAAHTHAVFDLEDGRQLRFVDPRTFGELFVTTRDVPELASLGIDPLADALTRDGLAELVGTRRARLKPLLLDQHVVAGLGNIYTDEILHRARLRWNRPGTSVTPREMTALHTAMLSTLTEAIEHRGSSLADGQYVDLAGRTGEFQHHHLVYAREGEPCRRCRRAITRVRVAGRSHFSCPACQR